MTDEAPKTAFEVAMERLRKKDADEGVTATTLSDRQRADIAEVRNFYDSKLAEREVLHQSTMRRTMDPEAGALIEQEYRRDRERLCAERDAKIERLRHSC